MLSRFLLLTWLIVSIPLADANAIDLADASQEEPRIRYQLTVTDAAHHLAEVEVTFEQLDQKMLEVVLPAWRTGKYTILNFANGIRHFKASANEPETSQSSKQHPLSWQKLDKQTWAIEIEGVKSVTLSYQVYANQLGYRTRHIDDSHLFVDGTSVFMYSPQFRQTPLSVTLQVPEQWQSRSGMQQIDQHAFVAADYDELADSPIESGIHQFETFQVDGRDYEILFWGQGNYDIDQTVADLKKLMPHGKKVWGDYPYQKYLFMVHATDDIRGATEHVNSTIVQRPRHKFRARKDYLAFMSTMAHEFVHTWNVKAYRPQGIWHYDFMQENYTPLLWLAEGSTSYFDGLLPWRADISSDDEYFKHLGKLIDEHRHRPGRHVMSVTESSWDKWIQSKDKHLSKNASVSIYSQGELVSLALDILIREASKGRKGYEDVHRQLYQEFPIESKGFTESDLLRILNQVSGKDFSDFYADYIQGTRQLDWDTMLEKVGLELRYGKDDDNNSPWLGITLGNKKNKQIPFVIESVEQGSPAWRAQLSAGDEIVAINGMKLVQKWKDILKNYQPDQTVTVSYFRRGQLQHTEATLAQQPAGDAFVFPMKSASKWQKELYEQWSGNRWPKNLQELVQ